MEYRIVSIVLFLCCTGLVFWGVRLRKANMVFRAEVEEMRAQSQEMRAHVEELRAQSEELSKQLAQAIEHLAQYETEPKSRVFSKVVNSLAAAGVPGLILLGAMSISGFSGAAAITVALSSLGGPAGMLGGIGVLVSVGIAIARFGIADLSAAVVGKLLESHSKLNIVQQIDALPAAVPEKFRLKAKSLLQLE